MEKTKVISLLKTFSKSELKELGLFVNSPFFNKEKVHTKLFEILKKNYPRFKAEKIDRKKIYSSLYPGKNYSDGAMRNTISDFLKLMNDYLRLKGLYKDEYYKEHFLMAELMVRNDKVLFEKQKRKIDTILNNSHKDAEYFLKKNFTNEHTENMNIKTSDQFMHLFGANSPENLISFIILKVLYLNSKILNENKLVTHKIEQVLDDELLNFLQNKGKKYLEFTYIKSFYLMYKLLKTEEEKYFFELKDLLYEKYTEIDTPTLRNLYTSLENYSSAKINAGNVNYYRELFAVYKNMVKLKIYSGSYGHMRHTFYLNIVSTGLEAGETAWVEKFIVDYKNDVYEDLRQSSYFMASAILAYWEKNYDRAIELVSKVSVEDLVFKINTRSLYLKIYYDINESEPFYSHIDSFKHFYTHNKQLPDSLVNPLSAYVSYAKKLFDMKNNSALEDFEIKKIGEEILANNSLLNKPWLMQKSAELEKRVKTT